MLVAVCEWCEACNVLAGNILMGYSQLLRPVHPLYPHICCVWSASVCVGPERAMSYCATATVWVGSDSAHVSSQLCFQRTQLGFCGTLLFECVSWHGLNSLYIYYRTPHGHGMATFNIRFMIIKCCPWQYGVGGLISHVF